MKNSRRKNAETKFINMSIIIFIVSLIISINLISIVKFYVNGEIYGQAEQEAQIIYRKIKETTHSIKNITSYALSEIEKNPDIKNVSNIIEELNSYRKYSKIKWESISWSDKKNNVEIKRTASISQDNKKKTNLNACIYLENKFYNQLNKSKIKHKLKIDSSVNDSENNAKKSILLIAKLLNNNSELIIKFSEAELEKLLIHKDDAFFEDISIKKLKKTNLEFISSVNYKDLEIRLYKKNKGQNLSKKLMNQIICIIKIHNHDYPIILSSKPFFFLPLKIHQMSKTIILILTLNILFFFILNSVRKNLINPLSQISKQYNLENQYKTNYISNNKNYKILEYNYISKSLDKIIKAEKKADSALKNLAKKDQEFKNIKTSKLDFISHVNHEIRTPLNALSVSAEIIKNQSFGQIHNKKYVEYINHIYESSKKLKNTISNLLEVFQAEAGIIKLNKIPTDLNAIISQCVNSIKKKWKHKKLNIQEQYNQSHLIKFDRTYGSKAINHILETIINMHNESKVNLKICTTYEEYEKKFFNISIKAINLSKESISYIRYYISKDQSKSYLSYNSQELSIDIAKYLIESHGGHLIAQSNDSNLEILIKIEIE